MTIALTRPVSPSLARCELTHLAREPIDVARAAAQHAAYEETLRSLGATVVRVAAAPEHPDAVFIEDTAVVLDEIAVLTRPGAASRRGELAAVAPVLARYRTVVTLESPATLDGGDVLRIGRSLYVGRSGRTNTEGIDQIERLTRPFGYRVVPVDFTGCLHLKSAATSLADDLVLLNPAWVSPSSFTECDAVTVDSREPHGANALRIDVTVIYPSQHPRTLERLHQRGLHVHAIDSSELAKAEGGVTCCSLIFDVLRSAARADA